MKLPLILSTIVVGLVSLSNLIIGLSLMLKGDDIAAIYISLAMLGFAIVTHSWGGLRNEV